MKPSIFLALSILIFSCIPLKIAPNIESDKVMVARKFKRDLPNEYAYIFEDPKNADEFYNFINSKFDLNNELVRSNVPFYVADKEYALTFYEREKATKTVNLAPIAIDAALKNKNMDPAFEDSYATRVGQWYLILTVSDKQMKNCLSPGHDNREDILIYLRDLRQEYLTTKDYNISKLRNKLIKH